MADNVLLTLSAMQQDPFTPALKTHKLKGRLNDAYAASAGYDLRIIFDLEKVDGEDVIVLLSVGTHDEVY
jgi:mRNA-degrading endonuclease YafQ of YafQ-DinJ toxin-antitoxin module